MKRFSSFSPIEPKCDKLFLKGTTCKLFFAILMHSESSPSTLLTSSQSVSSSAATAVTLPSPFLLNSLDALFSLSTLSKLLSLLFPNNELKRELNILHEKVRRGRKALCSCLIFNFFRSHEFTSFFYFAVLFANCNNSENKQSKSEKMNNCQRAVTQ